MRYLYLLLLTACIQAQTLNFSDFSVDETEGKRKAYWKFNAATDAADLANSFDLTKRATGDDSLTASSPITQGHSSYYLSGNDYYDANVSIVKTSDYAVGVWFRSSNNPAANQILVAEDNATTSRDFILQDLNSQNKLAHTMFIGNSVFFTTTTQTGTNYLDGRWHFVYASHDGDSVRISYDGNSHTAAVASGSVDNDGSELHVGADGKAVPTEFWTGEIATVFIDTVVVTTVNDYRKLMHLAKGWHSRQGNVIRRRNGNNFYFHQGFWADTLSYPATVAAGNRGVSITAFASDVDTLTVQTSLETKVLALSASPQTFTFNMMFAANDSLKLLDSSVADTIFASAGSVRSQVYVDTKSGGFKGWLGY